MRRVGLGLARSRGCSLAFRLVRDSHWWLLAKSRAAMRRRVRPYEETTPKNRSLAHRAVPRVRRSRPASCKTLSCEANVASRRFAGESRNVTPRAHGDWDRQSAAMVRRNPQDLRLNA
jgi:hypothetical protein